MGVDEGSLRGTFFRDDTAPATTVQRVQFENAQIRASRLLVPSGESLDVAPTAGHPLLLVSLTAARVEIDTNHRASIRGDGDHLAELLRFELKTKPVGGTAPHARR
ncbi:MAG: hypothetical protein AB7Q16_22330 [Vicinamibacterales bacterium]